MCAGWVPQCDTLYNLISDYRDKKTGKVGLNTEQQIMLRMASDYQRLMLKHKVRFIDFTTFRTLVTLAARDAIFIRARWRF